MNASETALLERLKEPFLRPHGQMHPTDGGDSCDTYEGWQKRGFQVVKGATCMIPRKCLGVRWGPVFGWHSVVPLTTKPPAARPLKAGEDDLHI